MSPQPQPLSTFYTVPEAATIARKHPVTIRIALEGGTLHGSQQQKGGRWSIRDSCLESYIQNERCEHKAKRSNVTPIGAGRAA